MNIFVQHAYENVFPALAFAVVEGGSVLLSLCTRWLVDSKLDGQTNIMFYFLQAYMMTNVSIRRTLITTPINI